MNPKNRHIMVFLCLISIFLLCPITFLYLQIFRGGNSSFLQYEVDDVFVGSLKHIIRINNPNPGAYRIMDGKLFVPIIRNETARHYAILHSIFSSVGQPTFLGDNSGNMYASWSNIIIDGRQTFTVEIDYYILSLTTHYPIKSALIADYNKSSDLYKKYTHPEELIQSNDSKIILKAQSITSNADNVDEKASKIYNFVTSYMHYAEQDEERGALWALESGVGDCSEYSYLFVALCRAVGVPARVQAGFAFRSVLETLEDGHMWAEYYLENYGWVPVDATWRLFNALDRMHFSSIQSTPEAIPYSNYIFNYTIGPEQVDEEQAVSIKPCSTNGFGENSIAENTILTIRKIKQAEFALVLGNVFGAPLIFPSEAENVQQTLLESQILIQKGIDSWESRPQIAQSSVANALESAEDASWRAWILTGKAFALFVGISIGIMLLASVFMKRHQTGLEKRHSEI